MSLLSREKGQKDAQFTENDTTVLGGGLIAKHLE